MTSQKTLADILLSNNVLKLVCICRLLHCVDLYELVAHIYKITMEGAFIQQKLGNAIHQDFFGIAVLEPDDYGLG